MKKICSLKINRSRTPGFTLSNYHVIVPGMELTNEQHINRHKDFLKANGELIAAFAWENFLTKGRGAVLVPDEDFVNANIPQLKALRFHYIPLSKKDQEPFKEVFWLAKNNPDEKVVLCSLGEGGGISSYLFGRPGRCSATYVKKKAANN